jgi:hypothetical protein
MLGLKIRTLVGITDWDKNKLKVTVEMSVCACVFGFKPEVLTRMIKQETFGQAGTFRMSAQGYLKA